MKISGKNWLYLILSWLGCVILVNLVMLTLAQKSHPGSVEDESPYEAGQKYQKEIDAQKAFQESGLKIQWSFNSNQIQIKLNTNDPWEINYQAKKTNDPNQDLKGSLKRVSGSPSLYESEPLPHLPHRGLWFLRVELRKKDEEKYLLWKETFHF